MIGWNLWKGPVESRQFLSINLLESAICLTSRTKGNPPATKYISWQKTYRCYRTTVIQIRDTFFQLAHVCVGVAVVNLPGYHQV